VRAQLWSEHGDVGEVLIDREVTVKTILHRHTDLWLKPENLQQGYPPIRPRPQKRVCIVGEVIGMAMWLEPRKRLERLPARYVGLQRPPMGVTDSRPAWIRPEGVVAVADARVAPPEASCRGSHAYERRKYCWKP
jgi:hypothetical protein